MSSQHVDDERRIDPLSVADDQAWQTVIAVLADQPRTEVVENNGNYVRAEVLSPWRFYTDDVELLRQGKTVQLRSSARIGWYDFNVNRDRMAGLREAWREAGAL